MKTIIKIEKRDHPYVMIDKRPLENPKLSWKAKGLLAYLLSRPPDWKVLMTDLLTRSTDGKQSIQSAMRELKRAKHAHLESVQDSSSGLMTGRQWVITEEPTDSRENRLSVKPSDGKSATTNNDLILMNENMLKTDVSHVEAIYRAYPRHLAKPAAIKAIKSALKKVPPGRLLTLTEKYAGAVNGTPEHFIPYPSTWFNQERYNDDPKTWGRKYPMGPKGPSATVLRQTYKPLPAGEKKDPEAVKRAIDEFKSKVRPSLDKR